MQVCAGVFYLFGMMWLLFEGQKRWISEEKHYITLSYRAATIVMSINFV